MTRSRQKDVSLSHHAAVVSGSVTGTYGGYVALKTGTYMTDVPTPSFERKIGRGDIINNPMSFSVTDCRANGSGSGRYIDNANDYSISGALTALRYFGTSSEGLRGPNWGNLDFDDLVAVAKQQAIGSIDSTPYEFMEDLGELRSTMRTISRILERLRKALLDLRAYARKLVRSDGLSWADAFVSAWLVFRFFLSPLVKSAHDAVEAYKAGSSTLPKRRTARGFSHDSHSDFSPIITGTTFERTFSSSINTEANLKATILYEVTNPINTWHETLGLRVKDIPSTAWQLFPYSFMIDRVIDITSFIKGILNFADPEVRILAGSVTTRREDNSSLQLTSLSAPASWTTATERGEVITERYFDYYRTLWEPSLLDTIPSVNLEGLVDSVTKIADLLALIWAATRR